jgi:hypothetical protein
VEYIRFKLPININPWLLSSKLGILRILSAIEPMGTLCGFRGGIAAAFRLPFTGIGKISDCPRARFGFLINKHFIALSAAFRRLFFISLCGAAIFKTGACLTNKGVIKSESYKIIRKFTYC